MLTMQIFTQEGLSHSRVLVMMVLYSTNCINSLETLDLHKIQIIKEKFHHKNGIKSVHIAQSL